MRGHKTEGLVYELEATNVWERRITNVASRSCGVTRSVLSRCYVFERRMKSWKIMSQKGLFLRWTIF